MYISPSTKSALRTLREEAVEAGNLARMALCDLALHGPSALDGAEDGTEYDLLRQRGLSQDEALAECEAMIYADEIAAGDMRSY